jgi:hypothetical protein
MANNTPPRWTSHMLYVPPTRNYTARNIYRQVYGPGLPLFGAPLAAAPAYAPWHPPPPQLTNRQINTLRLRSLISAGGRRYTNIQGRTHSPITGAPYTRNNWPVIQRRIQQIRTIPRALQVYVPHLSRRAAQILVGLSQPATNGSRPGLPAAIARRIASIVRRAEILNVRNNPFGAPVPRHFTNRRALPAPPRNNNNNSGSASRRSRSNRNNSNSNNSNNSSRPRRRARGNA